MTYKSVDFFPTLCKKKPDPFLDRVSWWGDLVLCLGLGLGLGRSLGLLCWCRGGLALDILTEDMDDELGQGDIEHLSLGDLFEACLEFVLATEGDHAGLVLGGSGHMRVCFWVVASVTGVVLVRSDCHIERLVSCLSLVNDYFHCPSLFFYRSVGV